LVELVVDDLQLDLWKFDYLMHVEGGLMDEGPSAALARFGEDLNDPRGLQIFETMPLVSRLTAFGLAGAFSLLESFQTFLLEGGIRRGRTA